MIYGDTRRWIRPLVFDLFWAVLGVIGDESLSYCTRHSIPPNQQGFGHRRHRRRIKQ